MANRPVLVFLAVSFLALGCRGESHTGTPPAPARPVFTDVGADCGITAVSWCGGKEKNHLLESDGCGTALFDYDGDGDVDVYVVSAFKLSAGKVAIRGRNHLYRNDGGWRFTDVTKQAGVGDDGWGCGAIVGDYDNDGDPDLFVTNYGPNVLYRNNRDGTFTNVTKVAGVGGDEWSTCATFFDADGDGDLDLYVSNYVTASFKDVLTAKRTLDWKGFKVMAGPLGLPGAADVFYENQGNGKFVDATKKAGLTDTGRFFGYAAVATDYDGDGDVDLYVANDSNPNFCYRNDGHGHFTDVGEWNGSGLSGEGAAQAGMGVDVGDVDGDLDLDLVVGNFAEDSVTLYRNDGQGLFYDATRIAGLASPTYAPLTWGVDLLDYDNDGDLDLVLANGHIYPEADRIRKQYGGFGFHARNQIFANDGKGHFTDVTDVSGPGFAVEEPSHGLAAADLDNDGDLDLVFVNVDAPPTVLRNDGGNTRSWILLDLEPPAGRNLLINAKVFCTAGGRTQMREVRSGGSYASQNDLRVHFGLGDAAKVDRLLIVWADGSKTVRRNLAARRIYRITR